jgi:transposase-like protein
MFPVSYRDLELMLQDRGVAVDHTTIFRWIQAYASPTGEASPAASENDQWLLAGDPTAVDLEEVIRMYLQRAAASAYVYQQ